MSLHAARAANIIFLRSCGDLENCGSMKMLQTKAFMAHNSTNDSASDTGVVI